MFAHFSPNLILDHRRVGVYYSDKLPSFWVSLVEELSSSSNSNNSVNITFIILFILCQGITFF